MNENSSKSAKRWKPDFKRVLQANGIGINLVLGNMPFIFFAGLLATLYIANAHVGERKLRKMQKEQSELKRLEFHYHTLYTEMKLKTQESEIAKRVATLGLQPNDEQAYRLTLRDK